MNARTPIRMILVMACFLSPFGCSTLEVSEVRSTAAAKPEADEAVIFGRLRILDNGQERNQYRSLWVGYSISLVRFGENETQTEVGIAEDGTFIWKVPRGLYLFSRITYIEMNGAVEFYPKAVFEIKPGQDGVYLGTLEIYAAIQRTTAKVELLAHSVLVLDEYETDRDLFAERYPGFQGETETALMVHDSKLPVLTKSELTREQQLNLMNMIRLILQAAAI